MLLSLAIKFRGRETILHGISAGKEFMMACAMGRGVKIADTAEIKKGVRRGGAGKKHAKINVHVGAESVR